MKYKLLTSAVLFGAATAMHASILTLGSFATTAVNPGFDNTATLFVPGSSAVNTGSTATYDVSAGSVWHSALGSSSYVSFNAGTGAALTYIAPNGDYIYTTSFTLPSGVVGPYSGTLTVLADDTLSVYLNGTQILASGGALGAANSYSYCSDTGPNCVTPLTFSFDGILGGMNELTFDVSQVMGANTGLDYIGSIDSALLASDPDPVPEPSSLVLLGTGLVGFAGSMRKLFIR